MPPPAVQPRLTDLTQDIDRLLLWGRNLPPGAVWQDRLNEMRLVRATLAWEDFLEQCLCCYLRGGSTISGRTYPLNSPVAPNLTAALTLALGTDRYGKWLNEGWMLQRTAALFAATNPFSLLASPTFREVRVIRHRIVHRSGQARREFRAVALSLHGSVRPGLTPGRLLSETVGGTSRVELYLTGLRAAAQLIAG